MGRGNVNLVEKARKTSKHQALRIDRRGRVGKRTKRLGLRRRSCQQQREEREPKGEEGRKKSGGGEAPESAAGRLASALEFRGRSRTTCGRRGFSPRPHRRVLTHWSGARQRPIGARSSQLFQLPRSKHPNRQRRVRRAKNQSTRHRFKSAVDRHPTQDAGGDESRERRRGYAGQGPAGTAVLARLRDLTESRVGETRRPPANSMRTGLRRPPHPWRCK